MSWEAASVIVEHTIPTLGVTVRSKLRITAGMVIETINPAFGVTHDQSLDIWRSTGLGTGGPTVASFPTVVSDSHPALCHPLLGTEDPPRAFRFRITHVNTTLNTRNGKLITVLAIIEETSSSSSVSRYVCEESLACISDNCVLLDTVWPSGLGNSGGCH